MSSTSRPSADAPSTHSVTRRGPVVAALVILAVTVAASAGVLAGTRLAAGPPATPGTESVDAGFARDMQAHHTQAVQMSLLVLDRSQDADVRTLARDVLLTQQQQAGQMYGWLEQWNLPQSSPRPAMTWMTDEAGGMSGMDHSTVTVPSEASDAMTMMPGMASPQDLDRLRQATGTEADRLFLQLMIPHHQGAVVMAEVAADQASDADVRHLARTIVDSQTAELRVLQEMLTTRGVSVSRP